MISTRLEHDLQAAIRTIPDYPKPGIMFRDITTLLGDARAFRRAVDELVQPWAGTKIDKVAGIEARGFILGGAVAHQVSAGFVPIRKKGKLPHKTRAASPIRSNTASTRWRCTRTRWRSGERVILVDDLIATGGTAEGAVKLLRQMGAEVLAACFIIDLPDLGGADKLREARRAGAHADLVRGALRAGRAWSSLDGGLVTGSAIGCRPSELLQLVAVSSAQFELRATARNTALQEVAISIAQLGRGAGRPALVDGIRRTRNSACRSTAAHHRRQRAECAAARGHARRRKLSRIVAGRGRSPR